MALTLTPAAPPSLLSENLRNPLGKGGMSRCVFDEALTRKMGYFPGGKIGVSRSGRLVLGRKERSVGLWRVLEDEQGWEKVLEMDLRVSPSPCPFRPTCNANIVTASNQFDFFRNLG
jgi:U3 small nucleolar RNA-associated protein 4